MPDKQRVGLGGEQDTANEWFHRNAEISGWVKGAISGKCNKAPTISEQLKIKFALVATNSMALVFTGTAGICSSWTNAAVR